MSKELYHTDRRLNSCTEDLIQPWTRHIFYQAGITKMKGPGTFISNLKVVTIKIEINSYSLAQFQTKLLTSQHVSMYSPVIRVTIKNFLRTFMLLCHLPC